MKTKYNARQQKATAESPAPDLGQVHTKCMFLIMSYAEQVPVTV